MTRSSSAGLSSMFRLYLKPEHPPGSTAMRSPAVSGETFSSAMNFLPSTAACSVTVRVMGLVRCVVAIAILQSGANLDGSCGQVNSLPRGCRHYAPNARRLGGRRPVLPVQHRRRLVLQESRQPEHGGVLSLRERSEEHTSELQSPCNLVCRLLLEKKKKTQIERSHHLSKTVTG